MIAKSEWRPLPKSLTIGESSIEGLGLIATEAIPKGTDLGVSHVYDARFPNSYIRLPLGGFVNHHEIPNTKAIIAQQDPELGELEHLRLVTLQPIEAGEEITVKYIINHLDNPRWEFEYEVSQ
ncbi:MAG: SET domain-containing protein-lysine N-methyltransferase [Flavobacteriaceae bacterium]|jgi:SET domain-containing protein